MKFRLRSLLLGIGITALALTTYRWGRAHAFYVQQYRFHRACVAYYTRAAQAAGERVEGQERLLARLKRNSNADSQIVKLETQIFDGDSTGRTALRNEIHFHERNAACFRKRLFSWEIWSQERCQEPLIDQTSFGHVRDLDFTHH